MNVVDSSGWIEYLRGDQNARYFASAIEDADALLVPTVCIVEVYRHALVHLGSEEALRIVAGMQRGRVIDLNRGIALSAAELGLQLELPLADSIILATARAHGATLWTQDADFEGLEGVRYTPNR